MPAVADVLQSRFGADLVLMAGDDRRDDAGCFQVHYVFDHKRDDWYAHVTTDVAPGNLELVSLAEHSYPASRFEREIRDLFGITPVGHPDPRPLVRHGFWPEDYFPLRRDALHAVVRRRRAAVSRSDRSRGPACTRSRSAPCTRASSNPATSASARSARRSST